MKKIKTLLAILIISAVIIALPGCKANTETATSGNQVASVTRGSLSTEISAAGNLALSQMEDLAVELFYPAGTKGTIGEVLVGEGDSVAKGQVLVTIDKSEWNEQLSLLEDAVIARERALTQAQLNMKNAEQAVITANNTIKSREQAVLSAEVALTQAENTLNSAITSIDFTAAAAALARAKAWYEYVTIIMIQQQRNLKSPDYEIVLQSAQEQLDTAQTAYDYALTGYDSQEVNLKKKQVEIAQYSLTAAKQAVIDAQNDIPLKKLNLELVRGNLEDAEKALEDAKNSLAEAQGKSPEILAPFDGIITMINVAGGDEVLNGTVAVQIADPDKFEAEILVSEMDIPQVQIGGMAIVTADALPGTILTATVTHISPTATISAGVVNYIVKVEVQSPGAGLFGSSGGFRAFSGNVSGDFGEGFTPDSDFDFPGGNNTMGGFDFSTFSDNQSLETFPITDNSNVELRQGFTVTVSITIASRTDVLMVPNGAVTTEGFNSYVQIIGANGEVEKRQVTTGISNWMYTEITEGLEEGEQVKVALNLAPDTDFGGSGMVFMSGGR